MNDDAQAEIEISEETKHEQAQKTDKPRGTCTGTGCGFEYQLGTARSGEFKGELVIRKHNSRVGPGLCEGASRPPKQDGCACGGVDPDCPNGCVTDLPHDTGAACADVECRLNEGHLGSHSLTRAGLDLPHEPEPDRAPADPVMDQFMDSTGIVPGEPVAEMHRKAAAVYGCQNRKPCADCGDTAPAPDAPFADPAYEPSGAPVPGVDTITFTDPNATGPGTVTVAVTALPFTDPAPGPAALPPISGQPEPDRDRWGRYEIFGVGHTRATTFAKLGSSTYALGEWNERMLIKGLTERPDLLALAHGKDVKRDKKELNKIVDDAQTHAGNKVAANIGTAYHAFTERLDAGLMTLDQVPVQYRARCEQYLNAVRAHGLVTRPEWMERTTAVRADQVSAPAPVAGTLDRIWQLPNGELVIGDLKTGSDLSYGWAEIAVQLALYAHGCNTFGLFDWNTKTWQALDRPVRTDFAVVMHLPADGDGCTLYRIDLVKGWEYAQVSGEVQSRQKDKSLASVLVPGSLGPAAAPAPAATLAEMERALGIVQEETDPDRLMQLYAYAVESGKFDRAQLRRIREECHRRWAFLNIPY